MAPPPPPPPPQPPIAPPSQMPIPPPPPPPPQPQPSTSGAVKRCVVGEEHNEKKLKPNIETNMQTINCLFCNEQHSRAELIEENAKRLQKERIARQLQHEIMHLEYQIELRILRTLISEVDYDTLRDYIEDNSPDQ